MTAKQRINRAVVTMLVIAAVLLIGNTRTQAQLPPLIVFASSTAKPVPPGGLFTVTISIYAPGYTEPVTPTLKWFTGPNLRQIELVPSSSIVWDDHPMTIRAKYYVSLYTPLDEFVTVTVIANVGSDVSQASTQVLIGFDQMSTPTPTRTPTPTPTPVAKKWYTYITIIER